MVDASPQSDRGQWKLILFDGSNVREIFPLTRDVVTIGRELDNDVSLDSIHVSKHHARLTQQEGQLIIEDLNSVNGTQINDELLTEPYVLQPDDIIRLGSFSFKVEGPTPYLPQSRLKTRTHPIARPTLASPVLLIAGLVLFLILIALIALLGLYWFSRRSSPTVVELPTAETVTLDVPTIVVNQAPRDNSQVPINQPVTVEAAASDATGVERIELRVNGRQVDAVISQLAQDVPSMTAALQWTPAEAGTYSLDIRAYNPSGLANVLPVATVIVVDLSTPTSEPTPTPSPTITPLPPPPAPTDTPTATPTPIPATATPAPASLVVNAPILNVRSGPSTEYNIVGRLVQGTQAEIVGQSSLGEGLWWQIRLGPGPGALGWVSADPSLTIAVNTGIVPAVSAPSLPVVLPTSALTPTAVPSTAIVRAPAGKALLIVSNRSLTNQPARLTLSGGKSVGGGREFDPPPNGQIEFMLEPDHYRALWSSPAREGGFARGADFTAVPGKVIVMWIVPEEGRTATEVYDELIVGGAAPTPTPPPAATPQPSDGGYTAPPGRALFVVSNRSVANVYAVVTISGGSFAGGQEIKLDATVEKPLELLPGDYRTIWNTPGFTAGREFKVSAGEVIFGWIIPEDQQVFMQFPGQDPIQINN